VLRDFCAAGSLLGSLAVADHKLAGGFRNNRHFHRQDDGNNGIATIRCGGVNGQGSAAMGPRVTDGPRRQPAEPTPGFASLLRWSRHRAGLTQAEFAQLSGLSVRTIRNFEMGRTRRPHADTVRRLADTLRLTGEARDAFTDVAAGRSGLPVGLELPVVPRQLPSDLGHFFTGRRAETDAVRQLLERTGEPNRPAAPAVVAITGLAGIGKSALAVHAGHCLAGAFPDGQLYADLHGATPGLVALPAEEILSRFLRALGMDDRLIPRQLEEAAAEFRSLVDGRRLLLLLDNAASAAQVRPLIPAGPDSALLITSRDGLVALDGAAHLRLGVLSAEEAVDLLALLAGPARVSAEPDSAAAIARSCGNLPLALRIAGARLAARPDRSIRSLADRLADEQRRLDTLQAGDLAVRTSFLVSYQLLRSASGAQGIKAAGALRLLALLDGPDVTLPAAVALLADPEPAVESALESLLDAHLLETGAPGRYRMHDLVRLFARELSGREEPEADRISALRRILRWYLVAARRADRLLQPGGRADDPDDGDPSRGPVFASRADAIAWLDEERPNLLAAARQAAECDAGTQEIAVEFGKALFWYLNLRKHWAEWDALNRRALALAGRRGDRAAASHALVSLGIIHQQSQRFDEAVGYLERGLALRRQLGDRRGEGRALDALGVTYRQAGRLDLAVLSYRGSLDACHETGDRLGEAMVLGNLGIVHGEAGRLEESVGHFHRCLEICRQLGARYIEGWCRNRLAGVYLRHDRLDQAGGQIERCLAICQELGDDYGEALALGTLGELRRRAGSLAEAAGCHRRSLEIFATIGHGAGLAEARQRLDDALRSMGQSTPATIDG
jgi:tetratricopeptide (TPR) repeat protein/transcriptional regulator with XRE-family HTH domain